MTTRCAPSACSPRVSPTPVSRAGSSRRPEASRCPNRLPARPKRIPPWPPITSRSTKPTASTPATTKPAKTRVKKRKSRPNSSAPNPNRNPAPPRAPTPPNWQALAAEFPDAGSAWRPNRDMEITATLVKQLRDRTGAPMMDCKQALAENQGDLAQAEVWLRKKGIAAAAKKAARTASEGSIGAYIHAGGKIGVLIELACETDFVARTPEFQALLHDLAMHVAAAAPRYLSREQEQEIFRAQMKDSGKPAQVIEKIVEGKLGKFYEETCLLDQRFIKDDKMSVAELVAGKIAQFGENIAVRSIDHYKDGEDLG